MASIPSTDKAALVSGHQGIPYAPLYVDSFEIAADTSIDIPIPDNASYARFKRVPTDPAGESDSIKHIFVRFQQTSYASITIPTGSITNGTAPEGDPEFYQLPFVGAGNHFALISPQENFVVTVTWYKSVV